ncbi:MAG TPA: hypothetical protein VHO06_06185, partial [Polyangia bacterium]|nr:hypothetical protein [Polyangia bacterium]
SGTGTAATPLCSMQPVLTLLSVTRDLVVVRGTVSGASWTYAGQGGGTLFVVGQQSAFVAALGAVPSFAMQSGTVSIRAVKLSSSASVGVSAMGGTLTLDHLTVDSCMGGGLLLDGAAFDIENTTVTRNGPGTFSLATWGGILVNNPPAGGPTKLNLLTIQNNMGPGVSCSTNVSAMALGVLAAGNSPTDINPTCGFSSCGTASTTCGAQP